MVRKSLFFLLIISSLYSFAQDSVNITTSIKIRDAIGDPFISCKMISYPVHSESFDIQGSVPDPQSGFIALPNVMTFTRVSLTTSSNTIIPIKLPNSGVPSNYLDFFPVANLGPTVSFDITFFYATTTNLPNMVFLTREVYYVIGDSTFLGSKGTRLYCVFHDSPTNSFIEGNNTDNAKKYSDKNVNLYFNQYLKTIFIEKNNYENQIGNLKLYSGNGKLIKSLWTQKYLPSGKSQYKIKIPNLLPGFYFIRFESKEERKVIKFIIKI